MPIVNNGRRIGVKCVAASRPNTTNKLLRIRTVEGGQVVEDLYVCSNRKQRILRIMGDVALIQEHFGGLSKSEAGRIAISLTANAIRKNRALPEVHRASRD